MTLYRVFPLLPGAAPREEGGPLFVPRALQGASRHDNPDRYGALYLTRVAESAVAERIQRFRGRRLTDAHLWRADGRRYALATIEDDRLDGMVDLDDPRTLVARDWRPSRVASRDRTLTQPMARRLFDDDATGLAWWSTLESTWTNVTLFAERAWRKLRLAVEPEPLSIEAPVVAAAADLLGIGR